MKIKTAKNIKSFIDTVNSCEGDVWLESPWGDQINLKSELSQYIAAARLIEDKGELLELFCQLSCDEEKFYKYFDENPEVMN